MNRFFRAAYRFIHRVGGLAGPALPAVALVLLATAAVLTFRSALLSIGGVSLGLYFDRAGLVGYLPASFAVTGAAGEIKASEAVEAVDGVPATDRQALSERLLALEPGSEIGLTLVSLSRSPAALLSDEPGPERTVTVRRGSLGRLDFFLGFIPFWIVGCGGGLLLFAAALSRAGERGSLPLFGLAAAFAVAAMTRFDVLTAARYDAAACIALAIIPATLVHWAVAERIAYDTRGRLAIGLLLYLPAVLVASVLLASRSGPSQLALLSEEALLVFFTVSAAATLLLIERSGGASLPEEKRRQAQPVRLGAWCALIFLGSGHLLTTLQPNWASAGSALELGAILFPAGVAASRLSDLMRLRGRIEAAASVGLTALIWGAFLAGGSLAAERFWPGAGDAPAVFYLGLFVAAASLGPAVWRASRVLSRRLVRGRRGVALQRLLDRVFLDLDAVEGEALVEKVASVSLKAIGGRFCRLLLFDHVRGVVRTLEGGARDWPEPTSIIDKQVPYTPFAVWLMRRGRSVCRYEMLRDPALEGDREEFLEEFDRLGAEMVAPLVVGGQALGFLVLGALDRGHYPDAEIMRGLDRMAVVLGLSLSRSLSISELERVSDSLEGRLRAATDTSERLARELEESHVNLEQANALLVRTAREGGRERERFEGARADLLELGRRAVREALFAEALAEGAKRAGQARRSLRRLGSVLAEPMPRGVRERRAALDRAQRAQEEADRTLASIERSLRQAGADVPPADLRGALAWAFEAYARIREGRAAVRFDVAKAPRVACESVEIAEALLGLLTDGGREPARYSRIEASASWAAVEDVTRIRLDVQAVPSDAARDRALGGDLGFELCCGTIEKLGGVCFQEGSPGGARLWILEIPVAEPG